MVRQILKELREFLVTSFWVIGAILLAAIAILEPQMAQHWIHTTQKLVSDGAKLFAQILLLISIAAMLRSITFGDKCRETTKQ